METELKAHSELPPSSADKWFLCPAWRRLNAGLGGETSEAAEEGTRAHEWMANILLGQADLAECLEPEMADYLAGCIEWVQAQEGELHVETRVDFGETFGLVDLTGTADVIVDSPDELLVADLKYGRYLVEVTDNLQLMIYLVGAVHRFGQRPSYRLAILQPRAWHDQGTIRVTTVSNSQYLAFREQLGEAIARQYDPRSKPVPGDHCRRYCNALGSCPGAALKSLEAFRANPVEDL
jgi:hypothetical protein